MLTIELDLSRFHQLAEETQKRLVRGTTDAVQQGLQTAADYARAHHQHHRRTGYLTSDAIQTRLESVSSRGVIGELHNIAPYAGYVEYGTPPHRIPAKPGGVLAFQVGTPTVHGFSTGTDTVFAKYVNHPGTSPMPFMHPAAVVGVNDIRRRLLANLRELAELWK